ncbi:MAG: response regulator [Desulfobacteraceae bacterium]|nr:response regulator [Desulfobacteraceae bacterium]
MILFCEECGTRNKVPSDKLEEQDAYQFKCTLCREMLLVSKSQKKSSAQVAMQAAKSPVQDLSSGGPPLKVLVVDDSSIIRKVLSQMIGSDHNKVVVGEAVHGKEALDLLDTIKPDVITLDINMPVMDGLTTLKHIMIKRPTPTVMISALTQEGATETFDALKYGAIDFLPKPSRVKGENLSTQKAEIIRKLDLASSVQMNSVRYLRSSRYDKKQNYLHERPYRNVVAIGAAEGGYGALLNLIPHLRKDLPVTYIAAMHQPAKHVDAFVNYLNHFCPMDIHRIKDGARLSGGTCYLAAAGESVSIVEGSQIEISSNSKDHTINRLMESVSESNQQNAVGVILTGAGEDGVEGLGKIIEKGGTSFVQDPVSCLFKLTPLLTAKRYDIDYLVSGKQMAGAINSFLVAHAGQKEIQK